MNDKLEQAIAEALTRRLKEPKRPVMDVEEASTVAAQAVRHLLAQKPPEAANPLQAFIFDKLNAEDPDKLREWIDEYDALPQEGEKP